MSVFKTCPHNNQECIHGIYAPEPGYECCKKCSIFKNDLSNYDKQNEIRIQKKKMTTNESIDKSFEPFQLHIKELKEENTKLKERNAELAGQKASLERWFGEAKAIIRKYYNYNHICGYSYEAIDKQAEQFLKEVYL